jgi:hypothetical protein
VFRDILTFTNPVSPPQYSYDWWGAIKVGLNQCWNLMPLPKLANSRKGLVQEGVLCSKLQNQDWNGIRNSTELMNLCRLIRATIVNGAEKRRIWNYVANVCTFALSHC